MAILLTTSFIVLLIVVLAVAILNVRIQVQAWEKKRREKTSIRHPGAYPVQLERALLKLQHLIKIPSVSTHDPKNMPMEQFQAIHDVMRTDYPLVHSHAEVTPLGGSIIFHLKGSDKALAPALLISHLDVVPAGDADKWSYPPFSGEIDSGYIWGRGTFDVKQQVTAILEACETLLEHGYTPQRSWYFAFGCDEEVSGTQGAVAIARHFHDRDIHFSMVLDEGGAVVENYMSVLPQPVAAVGIAEKGFLNIKLETTRDGGHSATPDNPSAVGVLSRAVARLDYRKDSHRWTPPVLSMLKTLGMQAPPFLSLIFINHKLFRPILTRIFSSSPGTDALIRTTHVATMFTGSEASNIIPKSATAVVNCRLLPGDTQQKVLDRMQKRIKDKGVTLTPYDYSPPTSISLTEHEAFYTLQASISAIFPDAVITPYLAQVTADAFVNGKTPLPSGQRLCLPFHPGAGRYCRAGAHA